ncbi:MAG: radical SAM protein [Terriglobia bacterium]|jgi:uncharacterized protein
MTPLTRDYFTTSEILHLAILPTEKCNFRCVYCNQTFLVGAMKRETVEGIQSLLISRKRDLKQLIISWFGGEPLLAYSTIVGLMAFIAEYINVNGGPTLKSGMSTNGYLLTPDRLRTLAQLGVREYQVTLDGDTAEHNALRLALNGVPTFDTIWKNLVEARDTDASFKMLIRLHVNRKNIESIQRLLDRLASAFGRDTRFEVYIRRLANGIGPNCATLPTIPPDVTDVVHGLIHDARTHGLSVHGNESWHEGTCAASTLNSFVIRADGRISKCLLVLDADTNTVGKLNRDGTMSLSVDKLKWWSRGIFSGDIKERGCPGSPLVEQERSTRVSGLVTIGSSAKN